MLRYLAVLLFLAILAGGCGPRPAGNAPDWADQVVYFAMTDRFADGDRSNNSLTTNGIESGPRENLYNGGDLAGLIDRLDYIQGLGMTAIWITPPVANQWWDGSVDYSGYHGYWALDLLEVDAHLGDLALYRRFVDEAHRRGLLVIQDIVCNHLGNFYIYENGRYRLNETSLPTNKPPRFPFSANDWNDPEERALGVYHFPSQVAHPSIHTAEFAGLDDLATGNPLVVDALKQSFAFWITNTGIDAFRIDTAIYVPLSFWKDFLTGPGGMLPTARAANRPNFLAFGEAWYTPGPCDDEAERMIRPYLENGFNSMIDFPLQTDLTRVFKEGKPPALLAWRLASRKRHFPPEVPLVTFLDNHDMARFLDGGTRDDLQLALFALFTLPGIPVIYYGTEQGFRERRGAMFAHGYAAGGVDSYDTTNPLYRLIARLAALRRKHPALRKGKVTPLFGEESGAGILAWRLDHAGESLLAVCNTADTARTTPGIRLAEANRLEPLYSEGLAAATVSHAGRLFLELPGKSGALYRSAGTPSAESGSSLRFRNLAEDQLLSDHPTNRILLEVGAPGKGPLTLYVDGRPAAGPAQAGTLPLNLDLLSDGPHTAWLKSGDQHSEPVRFRVAHTRRVLARKTDPAGDDSGPDGRYRYPTDRSFGRQMDILGAALATRGSMLELTLRMREISTIWSPLNGFDHVTFQIFIDDPGRSGAMELPELSARMPDGLDWDYFIFATGWNVRLTGSRGADARNPGSVIVPAPAISVDQAERTVRLTLPQAALGTTDFRGWKFYITSWDFDGISGAFRPLAAAGGQWAIGGGKTGDPLVMDSLLLEVR